MLDIATREVIEQHREDDVRVLALQAKRYPAVDMHEAVVQIEGWQAARTWFMVSSITVLWVG